MVKACEICGKRAARYICQECGREVCQFCFEPSTWVCSDCYNRFKRETPAPESFPWQTPFKAFLLGFILMFIGMIIMMIATVFFGASISAGTLIWIPPFPPIGFGVGPYAFWLILLAVALTVFVLVLFIILRRRAR
jgi:uncharacterized membrane protein